MTNFTCSPFKLKNNNNMYFLVYTKFSYKNLVHNNIDQIRSGHFLLCTVLVYRPSQHQIGLLIHSSLVGIHSLIIQQPFSKNRSFSHLSKTDLYCSLDLLPCNLSLLHLSNVITYARTQGDFNMKMALKCSL